ncbi:hypothetical protein QR680_004612 [Steinernema hermaphroditum]|uniref:Uncharacterized protein n=1 Tax=Steinernema hermaphroditum TaxID=289476 RepID=A0AA39LTZ5_9BILA|nr:hypothetical protein QR680_004612 [Steinernema hermaphroditum]
MVQLSELFAHIDFLLDNIPKLTDQISEQLNAVLIPILVFGVLFFVIALVSIVVCLIFWVKSNKEVAKLVRDEGNRSVLTGLTGSHLDQNWVETRKPAIGSSYVKSPNKDSLPNSPHNLNHGVTVATTQNPFVTPVVVNSSSTMTVNAAMSREDSFYSTAEPVATSTPYAGPLSTTV